MRDYGDLTFRRQTPALSYREQARLAVLSACVRPFAADQLQEVLELRFVAV